MTAISRRRECQWSFRFRDAKRIEALCSQTSNRSCPLLFTRGFKLIMTASGLLFALKDRVVYHFSFQIYDVSSLQRTRAHTRTRWIMTSVRVLISYTSWGGHSYWLASWCQIKMSVSFMWVNVVSVLRRCRCCCSQFTATVWQAAGAHSLPYTAVGLYPDNIGWCAGTPIILLISWKPFSLIYSCFPKSSCCHFDKQRKKGGVGV